MIIVAGLMLMGVAVAVLARTMTTGRSQQRSELPATPLVPTPAATADDDQPVVHSLRPWVLRGIDVEDAKRWIDRGFDADHAYLLTSMGVDSRTAAKLRKAGLDDAALLTLVEEASFRQDTGHDELVAMAERAPHLAPEAVAWITAGVEADRALAYAESGLTVALAGAWTNAGWSLDDALPWFRARFEPPAARAWQAAGFTAVEASAWKSEHFGVKQAGEWRRLGDTPTDARDVEQRFATGGISVADGLGWLDHGFTVDEICAGWPSMARDSGSWRADWRGLALSPAEIKEWHARFDRTESGRWIEVGVRDPELALRLTRRGLGPSDVTRVANRLAKAFDAVPVTRDDLLSAAGQLGRAGGSPELRSRLQQAATANGRQQPTEVSVELIEDTLDELHLLDAAGVLGAPHAARALGRRLEQGLIASALLRGREHHEAGRATI